MKFKVCPWCGSHLDYGERCDCTDKAEQEGGAQSAKADQTGTRKGRILDYCGHAGIDIEEAIRIKHEYNKTRPYRHGGKKC